MIHQFHYGYIFKRIESRDSNRYLHTHVRRSIVNKSQMVEATPGSTDNWMDKQNVVYTQNEILFSLKKKKILTHATTWINHEDILLSEVSQSQKENTVWFLLYEVMQSSQIHTNFIQIQTKSRMVATRGWRGWRIGNKCLMHTRVLIS